MRWWYVVWKFEHPIKIEWIYDYQCIDAERTGPMYLFKKPRDADRKARNEIGNLEPKVLGIEDLYIFMQEILGAWLLELHLTRNLVLHYFPRTAQAANSL